MPLLPTPLHGSQPARAGRRAGHIRHGTLAQPRGYFTYIACLTDHPAAQRVLPQTFLIRKRHIT
eukprot:10705281-Prorocentrum_lima.AAC.1